MLKKSDAKPSSSLARARQLAQAQSLYREKMKEEGFQILQEWLPEAVSSRLKYFCEATGLTKREALVYLINIADVEKAKVDGVRNDNRK